MAILLRWTFPVHINHIPETVKSVDYAGEQENKKLKDSRWFSRYHKTRKQHEHFFKYCM